MLNDRLVVRAERKRVKCLFKGCLRVKSIYVLEN